MSVRPPAPLSQAESSRHYARIARAIDYLRAHLHQQPTLEQVAAAVHLSPWHLQRLFADWAGVSPKRFLQYLSKQYARTQLANCANLLSLSHELGLGSSSRLHDLMVSCEAMTPGEIKAGGQGMTVHYGFGPSPFGDVLAAWTTRGLCHFAFCTSDDAAMLAGLAANWPRAQLARDDDGALALLARVFTRTPTRGTLHLVLRGTNFQIKVWEALIHTSPGDILSYRTLAHLAGSPGAQRAVGSALAANALGLLIPCHRVLRDSGDIGQYRWGSTRKLAMLAWEAGWREHDGHH